MIMSKTKLVKFNKSKYWTLLVEVEGKYKVHFKSESKMACKQKRAEVQANSIDKLTLGHKRLLLKYIKSLLFIKSKLVKMRDLEVSLIH